MNSKETVYKKVLDEWAKKDPGLEKFVADYLIKNNLSYDDLLNLFAGLEMDIDYQETFKLYKDEVIGILEHYKNESGLKENEIFPEWDFMNEDRKQYRLTYASIDWILGDLSNEVESEF